MSDVVAPNPDGADAVLAPVRHERIDALDFVRGVAVVGIIFANIMAFGQPFSTSFYPGASLAAPGPWDGWAWLAQLVVIDGKMRGLFTLLFGAGLALFMDKAWGKGADASLQLRRLLWLLAFGVAHFVLLWRGDILIFYAVAGVAALPFLRWTGRRLLRLGLIGYAVGALLLGLLYGFPAFVAQDSMAGDPALGPLHTAMIEAQAKIQDDENAQAKAIQEGDYSAFVQQNVVKLPEQFGFTALLTLCELLPVVLIGMGLYRLGLFGGQWPRRKTLWWSVAGISAGGGVTLALGLRELEDGISYFGGIWTIAGATMLPRLPMILGLAALLALAAQRASGGLGDRVRAAGRMAFSNYLGTSFVMLWVFHGFGMDLFGRLDRIELYGVAAAVGALMLLWSKPWLDRFRFGPLEWLWRCLTYGRRFPFRRGEEVEAAN